MQTFTCSIATENTSLAQLTGRKYTRGMNEFTFEQLTQLSKNTAKALSVLYKLVSGQEPAPEQQAFVISAQAGAFKRFYGPCLAAKDDSLVIAFGKDYFPITTKKGQLVAELPEGVDAKLSFQVYEMNGFDEVVFKLVVSIDATDTLLTFPLPLRLADYKAELPEIDALNAMFERKPEQVIALLDEPYDGSGSFDGPTLKLGNLLNEETYTVTGYRAVNTSNGPTFMVQIAGEREGDELLQEYLLNASVDDKGDTEPLDKAEVWANGTIKGFLNSGPAITPETPAQLQVRSKKKTKTGYITVEVGLIFDSPDIVAVEEDDLDFSF